MRKITMKALAEKTNVHIDTLFKIKRGVSGPSAKLAKRLENETGIARLKWLYPDEYGNPWNELNTVSSS